jgi:hypothetical protein
VRRALEDDLQGARLGGVGKDVVGHNARVRATEEFLGDRHLEQYGRLFQKLA